MNIGDDRHGEVFTKPPIPGPFDRGPKEPLASARGRQPASLPSPPGALPIVLGGISLRRDGVTKGNTRRGEGAGRVGGGIERRTVVPGRRSSGSNDRCLSPSCLCSVCYENNSGSNCFRSVCYRNISACYGDSSAPNCSCSVCDRNNLAPNCFRSASNRNNSACYGDNSASNCSRSACYGNNSGPKCSCSTISGNPERRIGAYRGGFYRDCTDESRPLESESKPQGVSPRSWLTDAGVAT